MKLSLLLCLLLVSAAPFVRCDDVADGDGDEGDWKQEEKHHGLKDEEMLTDEEFDEALLMQDTRKSLKGLSPEEAQEEVREIVSTIDRDGDSLVDKQEMVAYLVRLNQHNDNQQSTRVMEKADVNKDGKVSLEEFWQYTEDGSAGIPDENNMNDYERGQLKKFNTADEDNDKSLDGREFALFVHPHTSNAMILHVVKEQIAAYDKNNDGFISRKEYILSFVPEDFEGDEPSWLEDEKANFDHVLDKNQDGKLDDDEVKAWFVPDTETTNEVEMRHLFMSADTNRDNKLSVDEIVERFETFLDSSVTNNGYAVHEEL